MQLTSLKEYFDKIYSSELNLLTIPVIDLEKDQKFEKPLLSCMGRDIDLNSKRTTRKAVKCFLREVSDSYYKCQLGHCNSGCLCKRSRSGENVYWRFFDIAEHPKYHQLEIEIRRELFYKQTGILLEGNGYEQIVEFSRDDKNRSALKDINESISEYLVDQLLVDYAYQETNGFTDQKYNLITEEYEELISIAKKRHSRKQNLSYELQSLLIEKIQGKALKGSESKKPRIGDGSIDYRIMFMIKERAKDERLDYSKLENKHPIIQEVCNIIDSWDYFKGVNPVIKGKDFPKDCSIKAVRERYFAKHPV